MRCSPIWARTSSSRHGWLQAGQMLDGLGLAETTPGPLILVTEFVGFLAAWRAGGGSGVDDGAARRADGALGDLRALLPLDFRRRALCRMDQRPAAAEGRAGGDHGGGGRRHLQSGALVRAACVLRRGAAHRNRGRSSSGRRRSPRSTGGWWCWPRSAAFCCCACIGAFPRVLAVASVLGLAVRFAGL